MFNFLMRWILNSCTLIIVTYIVPGVNVNNFYTALIAVLFLSVVNAIIRPILLFFTLPINIITLGLFTLFINALMLWFVASFTNGFNITNYSTAFWATIIYWIISIIVNSFLENDSEEIIVR